MSEYILSENATALLREAREAKSKEDLAKIAEKNGFHATEEAISSYWDIIHQSGEMSDEELDAVSGGGCFFGADSVAPTPLLLPFLFKRCEIFCPFCGKNGNAPYVKGKANTVECPHCHKEVHVES